MGSRRQASESAAIDHKVNCVPDLFSLAVITHGSYHVRAAGSLLTAAVSVPGCSTRQQPSQVFPSSKHIGQAMKSAKLGLRLGSGVFAAGRGWPQGCLFPRVLSCKICRSTSCSAVQHPHRRGCCWILMGSLSRVKFSVFAVCGCFGVVRSEAIRFVDNTCWPGSFVCTGKPSCWRRGQTPVGDARASCTGQARGFIAA